MYYISKRMEIAGAHRLRLSYPSKCSNPHGHNWIVTVYCYAEEVNEDGMVADFAQIKEKIQSDRGEHRKVDCGHYTTLLPCRCPGVGRQHRNIPD